MLAIIGGSGLTELAELDIDARKPVDTPYGEPSDALTFGRLRGREVVFLARHGHGHTIAPHRINYRANVWALHRQGITGIVAVASVGGIRMDLDPGALVVPHQIIDYTAGRLATFFEGSGTAVKHIDFTEPYSALLRAKLVEAAGSCGEAAVDGAVYAATQGPRLETAAEIDRLERDGADIVGMTGMPEAALARELEIEYAAIAVVVNRAAGRGASRRAIKFEGIEEMLRQSMMGVRRVLAAVAELV